ncbi:MAG TPA: helix-turn-helix transcriptional regulator [Moheibacter sp.]|nr:helix-turn-helix transcriptional regulator [Moheibacter sp.]
MNTKIGKKIRTIREKKGLSQEAMADRLNISRSAYSRIETGETSGCIILKIFVRSWMFN